MQDVLLLGKRPGETTLQIKNQPGASGGISDSSTAKLVIDQGKFKWDAVLKPRKGDVLVGLAVFSDPQRDLRFDVLPGASVEISSDSKSVKVSFDVRCFLTASGIIKIEASLKPDGGSWKFGDFNAYVAGGLATSTAGKLEELIAGLQWDPTRNPAEKWKLADPGKK